MVRISTVTFGSVEEGGAFPRRTRGVRPTPKVELGPSWNIHRRSGPALHESLFLAEARETRYTIAQNSMLRPCYLVCDPEHAGSISTRKLVLETAKLNVLTAYSGTEAIETLEAFPAVSGAILDLAIADKHCAEVIAALKALKPELPVIVIGALEEQMCPGADYFLRSFEPQRLLELIKTLEPEKAAAIEQHDEELGAQMERDSLDSEGNGG